MNEYRNQEFRRLGFCCLQPTKVQFLDGSDAMVIAHSFLDSKQRDGDAPSQTRALRFYEVRHHGGIELISELELEKRMGLEQFRKLI